jgi:hypothetical protein
VALGNQFICGIFGIVKQSVGKEFFHHFRRNGFTRAVDLKHLLHARHREVLFRLAHPSWREQNQLFHQLGMLQRQTQRHGPAQRITNHNAAINTGNIQGLLQTLHKEGERMFNIVRLIGKTKADQVRHNTAVALLCNIVVILLKVAVTTRAGTRAVEEDHYRPFAPVQIMNPVAIGTTRVIFIG